jgi:hypothetical protein
MRDLSFDMQVVLKYIIYTFNMHFEQGLANLATDG